MAAPASLPAFWIFMYRVSPLTYLISGMLSTGLGNVKVHCSELEVTVIQPPTGTTCGEYLAAYLQLAGGEVYNPSASASCEYCQIADSNVYLGSVAAYCDDRWRNFGLIWAYVAFNIFGALFFYWYVRVHGGPSLPKMPNWVSRRWTALLGRGKG